MDRSKKLSRQLSHLLSIATAVTKRLTLRWKLLLLLVLWVCRPVPNSNKRPGLLTARKRTVQQKKTLRKEWEGGFFYRPAASDVQLCNVQDSRTGGAGAEAIFWTLWIPCFVSTSAPKEARNRPVMFVVLVPLFFFFFLSNLINTHSYSQKRVEDEGLTRGVSFILPSHALSHSILQLLCSGSCREPPAFYKYFGTTGQPPGRKHLRRSVVRSVVRSFGTRNRETLHRHTQSRCCYFLLCKNVEYLRL